MIGYRSFFTVEREKHLLSHVEEQLYSWLSDPRKGYKADLLHLGGEQQIGPGVLASIQRRSGKDGTQSFRARVSETKPNGVWRTDLTAHHNIGTDSGWVWLDVQTPEGREWAAPPRLAKNLLDVLHGRDGNAEIGAHATVVDLDDVASLVQTLTDERRRGLIFIAGSSDYGIPLVPWGTYVTDMLKETTGMATAFVLTPLATAEYNLAVGEQYSVKPFSLRSYLPGVDLTDLLDAPRHRSLGTRSIATDQLGYIRRILGRRARQVALVTPLPSVALRLDKVLRQELDERLLGGLSAAPQMGSAALPAEEVVAPVIVAGLDQVVEPSLLDSVLAFLASITGQPTITTSTVELLQEQLETVRRQGDAASALALRIAGLETESDDLRAATQNLQISLDDEILERALAEEERATAERQVRYLRQSLADAGDAASAWSTPKEDSIDLPPISFDDLLQRIDELQFIEFTGDPKVTQQLDLQNDLGSWVRKAWEALLALNDYGRESVAGRCDRDVDGYLKNLPPSCHGFSPNRHALTESEDVQKNAKFYGARVLPVSFIVDSSCKKFMGAHFKIAQANLISPRLHYFADTKHSAMTYVGYIGRHLPTKKSN